MNKQDIIKKILIAIAVIITFFLLYKFLVPSKKAKTTDVKPSTQQNISTSTPSISDIVSIRDVDLLRSKLDNIKVDTDIFSKKEFVDLKDYRKAIPDEPVGRNDPFARTQ